MGWRLSRGARCPPVWGAVTCRLGPAHGGHRSDGVQVPKGSCDGAVGADSAGRMLEIGLATAEGTGFIVHAMPALEMFLR